MRNVSIPSIKKIIHTSFEKQLLKSCSVRLFILIHFYANANTGITSPLDLEDLAQALDCNIKTVRSNILRLESCGFFDVSMDPVTEEYTFTIHDYTKCIILSVLAVVISSVHMICLSSSCRSNPLMSYE